MDSTTTGPARARPTAIRWRICALMIVVSFVAYLLRSNMSVAGVPMSADLGLSHVQLGAVLAAFAWGYAIFQFPGGLLGDVIGARRALTILAALWGVLNLLVAFVPGTAAGSATAVVLALMTLRFLMGAAQAPLFPIIGGGTTCHWFPVSGWALPNALQNFGATFGAAAAGPLIAWLMERFGWRASFLLTAPAALLCAGLWWWYVRDRPSEHVEVNAEERRLIEAGRTAKDLAPVEPGAWRVVIRNRQVQILTAGYFCVNYLFYFFFNWLFVYLIENRGFKLLEGGWYASIPWMAGAVGSGIWRLAVRSSVEAAWSAAQLQVSGGGRRGDGGCPVTGGGVGAAPAGGRAATLALPRRGAVHRCDILGGRDLRRRPAVVGGVRADEHGRESLGWGRGPGCSTRRRSVRLACRAGDGLGLRACRGRSLAGHLGRRHHG